MDFCLNEIKRRIQYAAASFSVELMREAYGFLKGMAYAKAISAEDYVTISSMVCRNYFNNAEWRRECRRKWGDI